MNEPRELFKKNGYTLLKNIVHPDLVNAISKYALLKEAYSFSPDSQQVVDAHAVYGDFLMEGLLLQYQPIVEWATGLKLLPTYSFYRVYRRGQELVKHTDRPSCEISMSVCYNFDYKGKDYDWNLYMNGTPIRMEPGDGAVYRGVDVEHWREPLNVPRDSYHIQCFYHYVDANGPYTEYAFDQKSTSHLHYLIDIL
jgi:hypothetical protein